uniref:Snake toxin/toxin-like domain-containing protein n=1 Tax=Oreochromis niloticus TaxID=8128 RepID=A0A669D7D8_ORENI
DGSISSPNGKKCFLCDEIDCTRTLTCNGNEEYCISTSVNVAGQNITAKGCASKLICSNMQPAQMKEFINGEISCCQGDLCNSDTTTSHLSSTTAGTTADGLLLFVTPPISLVLFS